MMTRLLPLSLTLALFATTSDLFAKDAKPLMIYGVSIGEEKAVVVKFYEKDGKPILEVVQSEPLGAPAGSITHHPEHNLLYIGAKDGRGFVYAVNDDEKIEKVREMPFKSGYCFLSLDRSGRYLLGASYESGNLDVYRLDAKGLPEKLVDSRNEKKTFAHSVGVSSDNRSVYIPYVKEENALYQYRFDPETGKLSPGAPANIEVPDAVGPRHLAFHPTKPYVYFSNEQQLGVSAYKIGPKGGLQSLQICAALETSPAEGMAASDIAITPDGRFLYVGVRGFGKPLNAVFGYAIGKGGKLKSLGMTATDSIPWALGMSPRGDHLFVTSSKQGSLAAYAIDNKGGLKKEASVKIGERFWDILVLGDAGGPGGDSAKAKLKSHFKPIFEKFGQNSTTKIKVVSGPEAVQMRNGRVAGKQWIATSGEYRFKLTIEDATGAKLEQLIGRLEKLPNSYMSACVAVSDEGEDGIAIYADLGGARAHGGKGYINLVPHADALVIAHEAGHTLEQVATESDPKTLDKWEEAINADKISVSDYGDTVRHEDLAEFAMVYAVCLDAGPEHLAELKKLSPKRFALWARILNPYSPQALRKTLDPFYKQHIVADGLVVAGSEKVSLHALGEAGYLVKKMLANRPDVMRDLCEKRKMFVAVMAYCELQTDLPDCRNMSLWWAYRARGLGSRPVSCGEENVLNFKGDPWEGENIFIHEFAHGIQSVIGDLDDQYDTRLRGLFDKAEKSGRFRGYAIEGGIAEFWAEGVQAWFNCNGTIRPESGGGQSSFEVLGPKGEHVCHLQTRQQLRTHMPEFAKLLDDSFRQNKWVYVPVAERLDEPHLRGFDPTDTPTFRWPPAVVEAFHRIEAERAEKERLRKTKSQR